MKTIAIGIPSGQSTRDVIYSGILSDLLTHPDVKVVVATPAVDEIKDLVEPFGSRVVVEEIGHYKPTFAERMLRSIYFSTLYSKCGSIRHGIRAGQLRWLVWVVSIVQACIGARRLLGILDWMNRKAGDSSDCAAIVNRHRPELVVLTRVFNFSADYQLLKEASRQSIPTVALVSSWDNLTTKGFFPFGVDEIVVWNEIMRQEAIELFDFPSDKIHIVGIPRFDHCFRRSNLRDRETFLRSCGLDPKKKTITYTTANRGLLGNAALGKSPEMEIINFLAAHIEANGFGTPTQLLARLHPLADMSDFSKVRESEHVRIHHPGKVSGFRDRLLDFKEEQILAETMCHSDVVVNIASTITIDAAIFDTPIVCVQFDWFEDEPYEFSTDRFYAQDHYQKLSVTNGYRTAKSREELLSLIQQYLSDRTRDQAGREAIVQQQCHYSDGESAARVAKLLLSRLGLESRELRSAA